MTAKTRHRHKDWGGLVEVWYARLQCGATSQALAEEYPQYSAHQIATAAHYYAKRQREAQMCEIPRWGADNEELSGMMFCASGQCPDGPPMACDGGCDLSSGRLNGCARCAECACAHPATRDRWEAFHAWVRERIEEAARDEARRARQRMDYNAELAEVGWCA